MSGYIAYGFNSKTGTLGEAEKAYRMATWDNAQRIAAKIRATAEQRFNVVVK